VETQQLILTNRRVTDSNLEYNSIPPATYDLIFLYDDGSFIHFDSLMLLPYTYTKLNMKHLPLQEKDSFSLLFRERSTILSNVPTKEAENSSYIQSAKEGSRGGSTIIGEIKEGELGIPIPYLMVLLKQDGRVVNGAYTDDCGAYQIFGIPAGIYDLTAGGTTTCLTTYTEKGIYISSSEVKFVDFVIYCSATELNEVEVVYVPPLFSQDNTSASSRLTGAEVRKTPGRSINAALSGDGNVTSVRGNRSDGEQIIIDGVRVRGQSSEPQIAVSKNIIYKLQNDEIDDEFENEPLVESLYYELMQLNSLRTNFSDVGFWEPKLS
jgi:hypothetical protein